MPQAAIEPTEDLTPRLRAIGMGSVYLLIAALHATASRTIFQGIAEMTSGSRILTLASGPEEGRLGAYFPLLPPEALAFAVSPWAWAALSPLMLAHIIGLWRCRVSIRSVTIASIALVVVTLVIGYSLTVELRCGQRL